MAKRKKARPKLLKFLIIFVPLLLSLSLATIFLTVRPKAEIIKELAQSSGSFQEKNVGTLSAKLTPTPIPSSTAPQPEYVGFCLRVPILLYHHVKSLDSAKENGQGFLTVDTNTFDAQMQYLISKNYHTISVDELATALINKTGLPPKSIVITLDDGYDDVYDNAYPILYKYQLKANLMIPTGLLGNIGYMSWDQLKRMVDTGLITAYNHSWSHASLTNLSDEKLKYEILTAKQQLDEKLGKQGNIFAYPYGSEDRRVVNLLRENGFIAALSTIPGSIQCDSFLMSLHRTRVGNAPLGAYGI